MLFRSVSIVWFATCSLLLFSASSGASLTDAQKSALIVGTWTADPESTLSTTGLQTYQPDGTHTEFTWVRGKRDSTEIRIEGTWRIEGDTRSIVRSPRRSIFASFSFIAREEEKVSVASRSVF